MKMAVDGNNFKAIAKGQKSVHLICNKARLKKWSKRHSKLETWGT